MSPVPSSRPGDPAHPIDDFEWPPVADDLSVYDLEPDPWQPLQAASSEVFAARQREAKDPERKHTAAIAPEISQALVGAVVAAAIVVTAAAWVFHRTMAPAVPVQTVHHPAPVQAPAAAPVTVPPRITIVATYPSEPLPVSAAPAGRQPAVVADAAAAAQPAHGDDAPSALVDAARIAVDQTVTHQALAGPAAPVDAPTAMDIAPVRAGIGAPVALPAAAEPGRNAAGIRSLLQRYEEAYDRRDVRTAATLWPSLDQRALTRAFAGLDRQDVHFDRCDIDASEARGSAVCVGSVRYVPSVGRATEKEDRITWTFDLARTGEDWRIAGLSAH